MVFKNLQEPSPCLPSQSLHVSFFPYSLHSWRLRKLMRLRDFGHQEAWGNMIFHSPETELLEAAPMWQQASQQWQWSPEAPSEIISFTRQEVCNYADTHFSSEMVSIIINWVNCTEFLYNPLHCFTMLC